MERLTYWNNKDKNSALPISINDSGDTVDLETICAKLAHFEDLQEQGRLVELPCKPNTGFFYVENGVIRSAVLSVYEIGHLAVFFWGVGITKRFTAIVFENGFTDCGETVFLTQAEAQAELERMEGQK